MVTLNNKLLSVEISTFGAELQKITYNGEERLWNGDPKFWDGKAPVLFPMCGGLKDDKFTYKGKDYFLTKHGFARVSEFTVERQDATSATFLLTDSPETLAQYPWKFQLRITYKLRGASLDVMYNVKNLSDDTMYMSIGAHEAYACPEGIEDYDIIFEKKENLYSYEVEGNYLSYNRIPILKDSDTLPLYNKYFQVDALVFKDIKSRFATLRNRKTGKSVSLDFNGFDYFLIWTKPNAPYVCLEPWTGLPVMVDSTHDITTKEGVTSIRANKEFNISHTIHF